MRNLYGIWCVIMGLGLMTGSGCRAGDEAADGSRREEPTMVSTNRESKTIDEQPSGKWSPGLTAEEKATLFAIAGDTLAWCVAGGREPFSFDGYAITDRLKVPMATFVTLKVRQHDALRGCIGSLAPEAPLYESVHDNAVNAALRDNRFPRVTEAELPGLVVHVSILSPITAIPGPESFLVGEHGIIIEKGYRRAVYLPEVATEQHWTREQTLSSLCQKAGLGPDDWKRGATFKVFSSVVLSVE